MPARRRGSKLPAKRRKRFPWIESSFIALTSIVEELDRALEHDSGLAALGGLDDPLGFSVFTYRVAGAVAQMTMALGGLDLLAFSGGVGENRAEVRAAIASRLSFVGEFAVEVIPAREELVIARAVRDLIGAD
jgi:acetate kinase